MADKSYDAVIIGGGHHGTIIAPYLAKAGLSVGVFERLDHLGGGASCPMMTPLRRGFEVTSVAMLRVFMVILPIRNLIYVMKVWSTSFQKQMKPWLLMMEHPM